MNLNQATTMEMPKKEGFEIPVMVVGEQPQGMLSLEALVRLCDLTRTPKAARLKRALLKQFTR